VLLYQQTDHLQLVAKENQALVQLMLQVGQLLQTELEAAQEVGKTGMEILLRKEVVVAAAVTAHRGQKAACGQELCNVAKGWVVE